MPIFTGLNKKKTIAFDLGRMSEEAARNVVATVQGKTFMNFQVDWGRMAGGCPVSISTTYETTVREAAEFLLSFMAQNLKPATV